MGGTLWRLGEVAALLRGLDDGQKPKKMLRNQMEDLWRSCVTPWRLGGWAELKEDVATILETLEKMLRQEEEGISGLGFPSL